MKRVKTFMPVVVILAAVFVDAACRAGEGFVLRPGEQPLLVVRADDANAFARLAATRQASVLEAAAGDFSGSVPGTAVRLSSLREFLKKLGDTGSRNLWYCLIQPGGMLSKPSGAMGWRAAPDAGNDSVAWLQSVGVTAQSGKFITQNLSDGSRNVIIAADAKTLDKLNVSDTRAATGWRESLADFLADDRPDAVGAWFGTRPLLGVASLATGLDFRALLKSTNLNLPHSARVELLGGGDDLGLELRFDGLFPESADVRRDSVGLVRPGENMCVLSVTDPDTLLALFSPPNEAFSLANLDRKALTPESVTLSAWKSDNDEIRWLLAALLPSRPDSRLQAERLFQWLALLAGQKKTDAGAMRLDAGGLALQFALADWTDESGGGRVCLLATDREENLPSPGTLLPRRAETGSIAEWDVYLDPAFRPLVLASLRGAASGAPVRDFDFEALLPISDAGKIVRRDDALLAFTRSGLTLMLAPLLRDVVVRAGESPDAVPGGAAAKLRFLLEVAGQSRFRNLPERARARDWPADWSSVGVGDVSGERWLDAAFPKFPGVGRPTSVVLTHIAGGGDLDGVRYRVVPSADDWHILADTAEGPLLRIDTEGRLARWSDGQWSAWREPLLSRFR